MTDTTTEAVERLMKDVTPGPWTVRSGLSITAPDVDCPSDPWLIAGVASMCGWPVQTHYNAAFIAAARDLVPALLAERDALKAQLAASQTPDHVTNADSHQPTRTYEDGVRDAAAICNDSYHEGREYNVPGYGFAYGCKSLILALIKDEKP